MEEKFKIAELCVGRSFCRNLLIFIGNVWVLDFVDGFWTFFNVCRDAQQEK